MLDEVISYKFMFSPEVKTCTCKTVLKWVSKVKKFCTSSLWQKNSLSRPITNNTKSMKCYGLLTPIFSCFVTATCIFFEFWLVNFLSLFVGQGNLLWFCLCAAQMKTALHMCTKMSKFKFSLHAFLTAPSRKIIKLFCFVHGLIC